MALYELSKQERLLVVASIGRDILEELISLQLERTTAYFEDEDTYIRKSV